MNSKTPLVSVVIPCHNKKDTIARSIESVKAQVFTNFECIVVFDNDQESISVAEDAVGGDDRFRFISVSNGNVADTRNDGIRASRGKYICTLDGDDYIAPEFLDVLVPVIDSDRSLGIVYTGITAHYNGGETLSDWPPQFSYDEQIQRHNQIPTCNVFRRDLWERIGGYRRRYCPDGAGSEDAAFWTMFGAIGYRAKKVTSDGLFHYFPYQGAVSGNKEYKEVDWLAWYPFARDMRHPFFSVATPINGVSHVATEYDEPVVSVIIPVGVGHEKYLYDAIDSVEAQSFRLWEIVVVNDTGYSGDKLDEAFGMLHSAYPFVKIIDTDGRMGAGFARNRGVEAASGDFILFLDADDMLNVSEPDAIRNMLSVWDNTGGAVYSDYIGRAFIDDVSKISGRNILGRTSDGETWIYHSAFDYDCRKAIGEPTRDLYIWNLVSTLFPRQWHFEIGGFDEDMQTWEDWDYWIRMAKSGKCFTRISRPYLVYRFYSGTRREVAHRKDATGGQIANSMLEYMIAKHNGIKPMACKTCGGKKDAKPIVISGKGDTVLDNNYKLVTYTHPNIGRHSVTGSVTRTRYGYHRGGGAERFMVHVDDIKASPHLFVVVDDSVKRPAPVKNNAPKAPRVTSAPVTSKPKRQVASFSLTDIDGVGSAAARSLKDSGYATVDAIIGATIEELSSVKYIGADKAAAIKKYVEEKYK